MLTDKIIPIQITDTKSSRNDNTKYKTITFWDPENDIELKTYVVSSYGNYTRWKKVINHDYESGTMVLQGKFRFKDIDVIDADSVIFNQEFCTWNDVADIVNVRRNKLLA